MLLRFWLSVLGTLLVLTATATAAPRKALIVDGQNSHNWKETTPILKKLLEETNLFAVDVATTPPQGQDMSGFKPNFTAYQIVVMNYNTGDDWPAKTKEALEKYVADGGGLVIFHAANNAFPQWKEYNEMTGLGGWGNRNEKDGPYAYYKDDMLVRDTTPGGAGHHGPLHPFQLIVRKKDHPVTKDLPEKFMHSADELYSRLRGPARNMTILATAFANPAKAGTGRDEPMLMVLDYGKGRVFHTVFGHAGEQLRSVAFIVTLQRGAEWAATGKVTQKVPVDFPGPDKPSVR